MNTANPSLIARALPLHQKGNLAEAERLYRQILERSPAHFDALHLLGVALHQQGRSAEAVPLIEAALLVKPDSVEALANFGSVLDELGRCEDALASYDAALALKPDDVTALYNRGSTLNKLGRPAEALASYDAALALKPDRPELLYNRGNVLHALKRHEEALAGYDAALALKPDYGKALNNRGTVLQVLKRHAEALAAFDRVLALNPDHADAHINRAAALCELARLTEAEAAYRRALALRGDHADTCMKLSDLLLMQGRVTEAIAWNRRAIAAEPDNRLFHMALIFALNFDPAATAAEHQAERARWNAAHALRHAAAIAPHTNTPDPARRLRVGYVSSHFRHQAATYAFGGLLLNHDPRAVDVICYSDTEKEDDVTAQLRAAVPTWRDTVGLDDDALAALIRADAVDILVDAVGHMSGNRLLVFARRPAPVQATAWGEPTGTGLKTMDYLLADRVLVPPSDRALLNERVVELPNFLGYWTPKPLPEPGELPALKRGAVTFGSFNRLAKIGDAVLRSWAQILRAVPNARLAIKESRTLGDASQDRIGAALAAEGVDPQRVVLYGATDRAGHFAAYQEIDIALDPFPHGGGMTTLDALWMGVPVVTAPGGTISSRLAAASLTALGLTDWIAADRAAMVGLAIAKAGDLDALAALRASLRARVAASPIGDAAQYARAVEAAYRQMWRRWCAEQA
jgi:predicted O-linked N-acetylglucosamine transferase (SPINDLY family)